MMAMPTIVVLLNMSLPAIQSSDINFLVSLIVVTIACFFFAFLASLRLSLSSSEFKSVTPEKAFGEFAFCALVLFFVVFSFMG